MSSVKVGDQLQHRPHLNVLKVQRDAVAHIIKLVQPLPLFFLTERRYGEDVFAARLVREVVVQPARPCSFSRAPRSVVLTSMPCTGVAKSVTSKRRINDSRTLVCEKLQA